MFRAFFMIPMVMVAVSAFAETIVNTEGSYSVSAIAVVGDSIAAGCFDGSIRLIDVSKSKNTLILKAHTKPITALSSDLAGKYILSAGSDGRVILWDAVKGDQIYMTYKSGISFRAAALSPDGGYAFAGTGATIYAWDTSTWENVAIIEHIPGEVYSLSVSSGGLLASGGKDGEVNIYTISGWDLKMKLKNGRGVVASIAFSAGTERLISGGYDKIARVWDIRKGEVIKELSRHTDTIRSVAAAKGGKKFATAGDDGSVFIWDIERDTTDIYSTSDIPATALALDPAVRFIAAGKGVPFDKKRYLTIWYPNDRRQRRDVYSFSDALVITSPLGYVTGSGSFADYVTIYENGRRYKLADKAQKYHRPERLIIPLRSGY